MDSIVDNFFAVFNRFFTWVFQLLPHSPFTALINSIGTIPYLANLNWFFPVTEAVALLEAWIAAIAIFYMYRAILSYIHLIG